MAQVIAQVEANGDDGVRYGASTFAAAINTQWFGVFGANTYKGFARFQVPSVEQGATINSAYLKATCDTSYSTNTTSIILYMVDADNPAAPTNAATYDALAKTAGVNWSSIGAWTVNTEYSSPDIKTIVQTVVNRGGWAPNQYMIVLWWDNSSTQYRRSFAHEQDDTKAMRLEINYTNPSVGVDESFVCVF